MSLKIAVAAQLLVGASALPYLNDQHAPLRLSYFPGRDDCTSELYRPLVFGDLAFVVNCRWTMDNVESILDNLNRTNRKAILSDSFIQWRSDADMAVYKKYMHVMAMYYAQDEGLFKAVSNGTFTPGEINQHIDSLETKTRVDAMIASIGQKIVKYKSISADIDTEASHVPVFVNEAKPILNIFDREYNVSGGSNGSVYTNYSLHAVQKMGEFNRMFFQLHGAKFDWYGFDFYDARNVTYNKYMMRSTLDSIKAKLPHAENKRFVLYPYVIKDDFDSYNRDELLMNKAILDLGLESKKKDNIGSDIALLFTWTGTKEMSQKATASMPDCERYLNATPPAVFTLVKAVGDALDLGNRKEVVERSDNIKIAAIV